MSYKCVVLIQGSNAEELTFLKLVEGSEWLALLQSVMQLSGAVTDLIDLQGSSVMLCLEEGWDLTCQVSSLAQLSLDPYYRTIQVTTALPGPLLQDYTGGYSSPWTPTTGLHR